LGVQTLCISLALMPLPMRAQTSALTPPQDMAGSCTQISELMASVQRQAADTAVVRYLLAEIMRALDEIKRDAAIASSRQPIPTTPSDQGGR
jgi:hypothetical protein